MKKRKRENGVKLIERLVRLKWLLSGLGILFAAVVLVWLSQRAASPFTSRVLETLGVGLLPIGSFILMYEYGIRREYQQMVGQEFGQALKELARRCGECERFGLISLSEKRESNRLVEPFHNARAGEGNWQIDRNKVPQGNRDLLEIKKYQSRPKHFIMIHRQGVYVGNYLRGRRGNQCPHFFLEPDSPIAAEYIAHFDRLWSHAIPA
ncbi:MAG: hypothetical protein NTU88_09140 [Armatimonadetes bacterium]|nr:hypothetical protein [Armatimonadota bacterium]